MNKPYQVQTIQHVEGAPGYGNGWQVVSEWQWKTEAREAADYIVAHSHSLGVRIFNADTDWRLHLRD